MKTFNSFRISQKLKDILKKLDLTKPTEIQQQAIPYAIDSRDIIAISNTGTGKTLAYVIPILNNLMKNNVSYHSLVLAPTRELAKQIEAEFVKIGEEFGLRTLCLIGGEDEKEQKRKLFSTAPHIIIGTPGRMNLISKSKMFKDVKYLVLDECDKLLDKNFEDDIYNITGNIKNRVTFLFSATLSDNIAKIAKLALQNPVKIEIHKTNETVDNLCQTYTFIPQKYKEAYLYTLLNDINISVLVFVSTCLGAETMKLYLKKMGLNVLSIHGNMKQEKRLETLEEYRKNQNTILIATEVAARGLDIPQIELVINYDLPIKVKEYIHRVGRTARAGKEGKVINFVTQYEIQIIQKIEANVNIKMQEHVIDKNTMLSYKAKSDLCYKEAYNEVKEINMDSIKRYKR